MKSCFMFGHSDCPDCMLPKIEQAVEIHYAKYGATAFYVGNRGRFDSLAAVAVKQAKQRHTDIQLFLLLAYHPAERSAALSEGFDGTYYPPLETVPNPFAIVRANRYMADVTDSIICYVRHTGNTRNLLEHARRRQKRSPMQITNLAESD